VQLFLENVEVRLWPSELYIQSDLRLRPVFKDEKTNLTQNFEPNFDTACVIEKLTPSNQLDEAESGVRTVFRALLLYEDRLVRYSRIVTGSSNLRTIDPWRDIGRMLYQSRPFWRHTLDPSHSFPLRLDTRDKASNFRKFYDMFVDLSPPGYFDMAVSRFSFATDMIATKSLWPYRLVEYVTSLEALLTSDEPEISYKLPMRTVSLLGGSNKERLFNFEFVRQTYNVRSKLVHGVEAKQLNKVLPMRINDQSLNAAEVTDKLHSMCQRSLRSVFDLLCKKRIDHGKESLAKLLDRMIIVKDQG
jgi:hypothetical protein